MDTAASGDKELRSGCDAAAPRPWSETRKADNEVEEKLKGVNEEDNEARTPPYRVEEYGQEVAGGGRCQEIMD